MRLKFDKLREEKEVLKEIYLKKEEELIKKCIIIEDIYKVKIIEIKIILKEKCDKEKSEFEENFD